MLPKGRFTAPGPRGAESDIGQATGLARQMVARWGMSDKLGMVQLAPRQNGWSGPGSGFMGSKPYSGETANHHDKSYPGEHEALLSQDLFDAVQIRLGTNAQIRRVQRSANRTLLVGKLFDDRGNRMSPTYSTKKGVRYRGKFDIIHSVYG